MSVLGFGPFMSCSQFIVPLGIATWQRFRTYFAVVVLLLASLVAELSLCPNQF
jgi:hypothetical protein